jgi:putative hydrolase of HD superfamily
MMEKSMPKNHLNQQIDFILEMDKLKSIFRRSYVLGTDRNENDAEHSWHLSIMAVVLSEYANSEIDVLQVLKMLLIHDIVEIDAGDTFCYDDKGATDKAEREQRAAGRIFGMLSENQEMEFRCLWEEFEKGQTPEAMFAKSLDRLMPLLHNYHSEGKAWKEHGITQDQVINKNKHIADGSKELWEYAYSIIGDAVEKGYLAK